MSRCTQRAAVVYQHVARQPLEHYRISRSKVKVTWVLGCLSVCVMLRLPADST